MTEDLYAEARAEARYEAVYAEKTHRADLEANPEKIQVGEGITLVTSAGGLYVPFTVVAVRRNGRELDIQRDKTVIDGPNDFEDRAPRHYERDLHSKIETVTKRKDGTYIVKGTPMEWYSTRYCPGFRRDWTDYSQ